VPVTHAFTSAKSDGGDATLVKPSNWNAVHTLTQLPVPLRTTSIQTINGTSYQNITDLTLAVLANKTYHYKFIICFRCLNATTGFGFSVNGPAQNHLHYRVEYQTAANATASTDAFTERKDSAYDAMAFTTGAVTANVDLHCVVEGIVATTASGTLAARVRSELANNDLTIRDNSVGFVTEMP
jgi:hypothetical protein